MAVTEESAPAGLTGGAIVRAFIAVPVPSAAPMVEALRSDNDLTTLPVRWLGLEGLHVTIAFLGDCSTRELAAAWPRVTRALAGRRPLTLTLGTPELFPDAQHPRLVVAPVSDSRNSLQSAQTGIVESLKEIGVALGDRAFRPHVSLGRLRPPLLRGQTAAIAGALRARSWSGVGAFDATSVCLMRSDLFPDGARYTILAEATLGAR